MEIQMIGTNCLLPIVKGQDYLVLYFGGDIATLE